MTKRFSIRDITRAVNDKTPLPQWEESIPEITRQRDMVENFLNNGGRAYGFSTLFGHLDNYFSAGQESDILISSHRIGNPSQVSEQLVRSLTTVKLCQLSNGHTGISTEAYKNLISSFGAEKPSLINVHASYGSGDVIPATWWATAVLGQDYPWKRGDVMSLINGNFVATGVILSQYSIFSDVLNRCCEEIEQCVSLFSSNVQLPVSSRDTTPLHDVVESTIESTATMIERSCSRVSSNPLFFFSDSGDVDVQSNSSFIDFSVTMQAVKMSHCLMIVSSYLSAVTHTVCSYAESCSNTPVEKISFVQYPKASKAYYDTMSSRLTTSFAYYQSESGNIEDIADFSLATALIVQDSLDICKSQYNILRSARSEYMHVVGS